MSRDCNSMSMVIMHVHCFLPRDPEPTCLVDTIAQLAKQLCPDTYEFNVRRDHVLEDLLKETTKRAFHPLKRVKVCIGHFMI